MRTKQNFIADKMLVLATSAKVAVAATRVGRCKIVRVLFDFFFFFLLIQLGALLFVVTTVNWFLTVWLFGIVENYVAEGLLIKSN